MSAMPPCDPGPIFEQALPAAEFETREQPVDCLGHFLHRHGAQPEVPIFLDLRAGHSIH